MLAAVIRPPRARVPLHPINASARTAHSVARAVFREPVLRTVVLRPPAGKGREWLAPIQHARFVSAAALLTTPCGHLEKWGALCPGNGKVSPMGRDDVLSVLT